MFLCSTLRLALIFNSLCSIKLCNIAIREITIGLKVKMCNYACITISQWIFCFTTKLFKIHWNQRNVSIFFMCGDLMAESSSYPDRCGCTQTRSLRDPTQTVPCVPRWVRWRSNGHLGCRGFPHTRPVETMVGVKFKGLHMAFPQREVADRAHLQNIGKWEGKTTLQKDNSRHQEESFLLITCNMSSSSMRSVQLMRSTLVSEPLYSMTIPLKVISLLNMATTKFPLRRELDWLSDNAGIRNRQIGTTNKTTKL